MLIPRRFAGEVKILRPVESSEIFETTYKDFSRFRKWFGKTAIELV